MKRLYSNIIKLHKIIILSAILLAFVFLLTSAALAQDAKDYDKLRGEAETFLMQGKFNDSLVKYEQALVIAEKLKDKNKIAFIMGSMGVIYKKFRQYDKALDCYQKSVDLYRELGDKKYESIFGGYMANVYLEQGQPEKALTVYNNALKIAQEIKDRKSEAAAIGNIGNIYSYMGDYKQAIENFEKAAALGKEVGDIVGEGRFTANMGILYSYLGEYKKSRENYTKSAAIILQSKDKEMSAVVLGKIADLSVTMGEYNEALNNYNKALTIAGEMDTPGLTVKYLLGIARTYAYMGDMVKSLEYYKKAGEAAEKSGGKDIQGDVLMGMGGAYIRNGSILRGIELYKKALALYKEAGSTNGEGSAYSSLARAYMTLCDYDKAEENYKKSILVAKNRKNWKQYADNIGNLGIVYSDIGDYKKAIEYYEQAREISEKTGDWGSVGAALLNIGLAYSRMGEFLKAMSHYEKALTIAEKLGNKEVEATSYGNLGLIYFNFADHKNAYKYYIKALNINKEIGNKEGQLINLLNIGALLMKMKKYDNSMKILDEALELAKTTGNKRVVVMIMGNKGAVSLETGKFDAAAKELKETLKGSKNLKDSMMEFNSVLNLGFTYHMSAVKNNNPKLFSEALSYYRKAEELAERSQDSMELLAVYARMGIFFDAFRHKSKEKETQRREEAITYLKKSIDLIEKMRGEIKIDDLQLSFLNKYIVLYNLLIQILLEQGKPEEAFAYAERSKARMFLDSLGSKKIIPKNSETRELAEKEQSLSDAVQQMTRQLSKLSDEEAVNVRISIKKLRKERDEIIERIKRINPEYAALISVSPSSLKEIQKSLKPDEALVEYYCGTDNTVAWVLTNETMICKNLPVSYDEIMKETETVRDEIIPHEGDTRDEETMKKTREKLASIYGQIISPLEPALNDKKQIIIVPHSSLHQLPFAALIDGDGKFLVEKYSLLIEPSASSLVNFRKRNESRPSKLAGFALGKLGAAVDDGSGKTRGGGEDFVVIRGDFLPEEFRKGFSPLPGTKEEIMQIRDTIKGNNTQSDVFIEKEFTIDAVMKSIKDAGIIHFATHGFLSSNSGGSKSGLLASDGLLYVLDIYNWELNSDLVVLSACQTGMGDVTGGDEMVSISRAFMQAGADNIMASLWSVQDEATRDLMVEFYDNLFQGKSKADALRNAQMKLLKKNSDPYLWAPFVLSGKG